MGSDLIIFIFKPFFEAGIQINTQTIKQQQQQHLIFCYHLCTYKPLYFVVSIIVI